MLNRLLTILMVLTLFALGQIGVATHAVEHITEHTSAAPHGQEEDAPVDSLCLQCLAKAQAEQFELPSGLTLPVALATNAHLALQLSIPTYLYLKPYSARAPPSTI